jgi:tetratricopeptide (TPR) repeat protein
MRYSLLPVLAAALICAPSLRAQPGGVSTPTRPTSPGRPVAPSPTQPARPLGPTPAPTSPVSTGADAPGSADAPTNDENVNAAIEFFKKGEVQKCVERLNEAVQKNKALPPAKIMLSRMYFNAGNGPLGRIAMEQAAMEAPTHPDVYISFGRLALQEGRLLDAELQLREGLETIKHGAWTADQERNIRLNCLSGLAEVAERRGQWDAARERLKTILDIDPKSGAERSRYGRALFMLEKRDDAANELEQAAKDDPRFAPFSANMAALYMSIRNKPKAEEWYLYGIKLEPKSVKMRQAFANFLMDEGRLDEAATQLKEALAVEPKNVEARYIEGLLARLRKDYDRAEAIFNEIVAEKPDLADAKNQLALVLAVSKDEARRRRALEIAEANTKANPRSAEYASTFAWVLFKLNRLDEAERLFQQVFQSGQVSSDAAYFYANVLGDRGRLDDVKRLLRGAVDSEGRFYYRQEANEWLKNLERRP